ncbi:MAG: DUF1580 domain-containing protein [Pirellulales bacterium]|nr:DUF1580 domain-containing protein [Pirellulales bacterium]
MRKDDPHGTSRDAPVAHRAAAALLTTAQVCDLAEDLTGIRPAPSTVFRWATKGTRGRKLPFRRLGSRLLFPRLTTLHFLGGAEPDAAGINNDAAGAVADILGTTWAGQPSTAR